MTLCERAVILYMLHKVLFIRWQWGLEPEAVVTALMFSSCEKVLLFDGGGGGVLMDSFLPDIEVARSWPLWPEPAHSQMAVYQEDDVVTWFHAWIATLSFQSMSLWVCYNVFTFCRWRTLDIHIPLSFIVKVAIHGSFVTCNLLVPQAWNFILQKLFKVLGCWDMKMI